MELQGRWQIWPSSPCPVQLFHEWSVELSHSTALGWTLGLWSCWGLGKEEWAEHTAAVQSFPCKPFRITELCLLCIPMEQADEEEDVTTPTEILCSMIWHLTCSDADEHKSSGAAGTDGLVPDWCCPVTDCEESHFQMLSIKVLLLLIVLMDSNQPGIM